MKTCFHKSALILIAALALPTLAFAAAGTVNLTWTPSGSPATSPGSSVTLSLDMNVAGFSDPDRVGGYDFLLTSLNDSSGKFFIQSRTLDTTTFSDPQANDATVAARPGSNLDPTNNLDLGASVPLDMNSMLVTVSNGSYHLANYVIGIDAGVAPGTYNFNVTSGGGSLNRGSWSDQNGTDHDLSSQASFSITVVPEPATWSLIALGGLGTFGLNLIRARRRA